MKHSVSILAAILLVLAASAAAQVATADAEEFVGEWVLDVDFNGSSVEMTLDIQDLEGKLVAELTSSFFSEQAITDIERDGSDLHLTWMSEAVGETLKMQLQLAEGVLSGSFGDESGTFAAEFSGTKSGAGGDARAASRRGSRRGGNSTELVIDGQKIKIAYASLEQTSPDYAALEGLGTGEVHSFTTGRATKLLSDFSLKFGDTVVPKGNAAEDYPGVYSLWLKKVEDGWSLVFNSDADIWGSQRLSEVDVVEVALDSAPPDGEHPKLEIDLIEAAGGGLLRIIWGDYLWLAPFEVVE